MTTRSEPVRVFVAVGLSNAAREQLIDAVARIRQDIPDGIQWADPSGMHVTLKFLGNIPASDVPPLLACVEAFSGEHHSFRLQLTGLGMFPNHRKPRVLWAGLDGDLDALSLLQQAAEGAITTLGHPPEERPFRPHITLGRPRRTLSDADRGRIGEVMSAVQSPLPVPCQVESVEVMRSELHPSGARYTVLGSASLKSPLRREEG